MPIATPGTCERVISVARKPSIDEICAAVSGAWIPGGGEAAVRTAATNSKTAQRLVISAARPRSGTASLRVFAVESAEVWSGIELRRCNMFEDARVLREVEGIHEIVCAPIRRAERALWYSKGFLGKGQDAAELVLCPRNVSSLGVRRDDQQRYAETELVIVVDRRFHVIVPPTPVVPRDENRGALPILTLTDRVDDRRDPRRSFRRARPACVIGPRVAGNHPRHTRETSLGDIFQNFGRRHDNVLVIRTVPHVSNRVESMPNPRARVVLVVSPRHAFAI